MITVSHLYKSFTDFPVLQDLSLQVNKGSIYGLIGQNGAGKTTLLKHITGILKQDRGEILIDNSWVYENVDLKKRIGYIPDELYFFANHHLNHYAQFYRALYPLWNQKRFEELSKHLNLDLRCNLTKFSKGMQKQAAFVLALSCQPDYLILDEPIDGLDPLVRKQIWQSIVADVAEREMTVLVSSHNLRELEGICDSIGILARGTMLLQRDLDELKTDLHKVQVAFSKPPENPYQGFHILHHETQGAVELLILKGKREEIENTIRQYDPLIFDLLPLTLEEIFIYELGGNNDEIQNIIF